MTRSRPPSSNMADDFNAIEIALSQTARGRQFLADYLNRNRCADNQLVLNAIDRLKEAVLHQQTQPGIDKFRMDLIEMSRAIARTREEIASIRPDTDDSRILHATEELDAIVRATEQATSDILQAAEEIQEAAWTMRESGAPEEICDQLDNKATDIYTACSFQDITGQRTTKVVQVLRYLEARIHAMIDIWGLEKEVGQSVSKPAGKPDDVVDSRPDAHLLNGPQLASEAIDQDEIDAMLFDGPDTGFEPDTSRDMGPPTEHEWEEVDASVSPPVGDAKQEAGITRQALETAEPTAPRDDKSISLEELDKKPLSLLFN